MNLTRRAILALALMPGITPAFAQTFPTVPAQSFIGRLGIPGDSGPSQALPFSVLAQRVLNPNNIAYGVLTTGSTGLPAITHFVILPNDANGGAYEALNNVGAAKNILSVGNNSTAINSTRLRSAGGGVTIENSSTNPIAEFLENGNFGIGVTPSVQFDFETANAVGSAESQLATQGKVFGGSSGSPITTAVPMVAISRREAISTDTQGGQNPALWVESVGNNTSSAGVVAQVVALTAEGTQLGSGDVVGGYFVASQAGASLTGPHRNTSYGLFAQSSVTTNGANAYGAEIYASNNTGVDYPFGGGPNALALHVGGAGSNLSSIGIWVESPTSANRVDVGIYFDPVSAKTTSIRDDSTSVTSMAINGSHTDGINTTGGTFSGKAIKGTGYSIDGAGVFAGTGLAITGPGILSQTLTDTKTGGGPAAAFLASAVNPAFALQATGQSADQKIWDIFAGGNLQFRAVNDANSASHSWMTVTRGAGATVAGIALADPVTVNSSLTVTPAAGSLTQGLQVTQSPTGTTSPGFNALNSINITSDTVNNGDGNEYTAFSVIHQTGGATVLGQRSALHVAQILTAATNPAKTQPDIVGATLQVVGQVGNAGGNFIAANSAAILNTGATGAGGLTGHEIDISAQSGSSVTGKYGLTLVQISGDAVQGSSADIGFLFVNGGSTGGWKQGIAFGASTVSSGGVAIDMSALAAGGPAFLLKGPSSNFYVDGNGNIGGRTLTLTGTSPSIIMPSGAAEVFTIGSGNTGFINSLIVQNSGTVSNSSTAVSSVVSLSAGTNAFLQMVAVGGASPAAQLVSGAGMTGGLNIAALAGALSLTSPVLTGAALGTPISGTMTNVTGLPTTALTGALQAAQEPAHTGDVTNTAGSLALTLATAQPAVHTWALAQTFTVAPVFTDAAGSRTALGLGTAATQSTGTSGAAIPFLNGANTWAGGQTFGAAITYGGVTLSNAVTGTGNMVLSASPTVTGTLTAATMIGTAGSITGLTGFALRDTSAAFDVTLAAVSSTTLTAGRTLTLDMGNVAHTLKFGTTANTITFPNVASDTVAMLGTTQTWTGVNTINTNSHFAFVGGTGGGFWLGCSTTANCLFFGSDAATDNSFRIFSALPSANMLLVTANVTAAQSLAAFAGTVGTGATTFAGLPGCGGSIKGHRHFVTDATQTLTAGIGATVAGGGANNVPVVCDGTNWKIGANDNIPAHLMRKYA